MPELCTHPRRSPEPANAKPSALPIGRFGRPEEAADLALAILGSGYLTNQVLSLDGGAYPR